MDTKAKPAWVRFFVSLVLNQRVEESLTAQEAIGREVQ